MKNYNEINLIERQIDRQKKLQNNNKNGVEFSLAQKETVEKLTHLLLSHEVSCEDENSKNLSQHSTKNIKKGPNYLQL